MSTNDFEGNRSLSAESSTRFKRESLLVYLDNKGCPLEWLNHIKDFYEQRRKEHPVYKPYPNPMDCETHFPFGKYAGKPVDSDEVPIRYKKWLLSQQKMMLSYPLLTNALKKLYLYTFN